MNIDAPRLDNKPFYLFVCRCLWLTGSRWHWWWIWTTSRRRTPSWWRAFVRTQRDTSHSSLILCTSFSLNTESVRYTHTESSASKVWLAVFTVVHILFHFRWWLKMHLMFTSNTVWWWREEVATLLTHVILGTSTLLSSWEDCECVSGLRLQCSAE